MVNAATATDDHGLSATSAVSRPTEAARGLSVVKTWSTNDTVDGDDEVETAGQEIDYTIVVTNTGNTTLREGTVQDSRAGHGLPSGDLADGASATVYDS